MAEAALTGLRVLECGDFVAAPYAATMLGHLGADVVKVEPPAGDSNRRRGPFPPSKASVETSGLHLFLDQAKRSVVLDLDSENGRVELRRLAAAADLLVASGPADTLLRQGLTYTALHRVNPALVVVTITPLGLDAAAREQGLPMRPLCDLAVSGWLSISPGGLEDPNLPPLQPFGQQAHFQAGIHAAIAALGAMAAREAHGVGQHVDVSVQAVVASQLENALQHFTYSGRVASRLGSRLLGPWGMVALADGLLFIICVTEEEWRRLVAFMGSPGWAAAPLFADRVLRGEHNDALLLLLEAALAGSTVEQTYAALQQQRIPCAPILEMRDLLQSTHLRARGYFNVGDHPLGGSMIYPGAPWQLGATPWQAGRPAPQLGEHGDEVYRAWATPRAAPRHGRRAADHAPGLPLEGLRIADFTWAWAGPSCTLQLAHLGADVIKVESTTLLDTFRALPPFWQNTPGPNRSGTFNQYSQGKRSLVLNLKQPRGLQLAYDVVRQSDVVVDNFSAGVMQRLGLGYDTLRTIKPDIVQISMAAHGQTGPLASYIAYGPAQVPMTGLAALTGYPGGGPRGVGISYGDPNGGNNAAVAVLAALYHRRRTGEGQYIDMSQWEAAVPLAVEGLLSYQMLGQQPARMGNRDEFEAPQGVFRCVGEEQWLAVSCWSDREWRALAAAIGRPDLRDDADLATRAGRKAREAELEQAIASWTGARARAQAEAVLRAAGVPAQGVLNTAEVAADPTLAAWNFWVELPHAECTGARHAGIPWRFSGTPLQVRRAAPSLGQHTEELLRGLLEQSAEQIEALRAAGALV